MEAVPAEAVLGTGNSGGMMAIITNEPEQVTAWHEWLDRIGLKSREVAQHQIAVLGAAFTIHAWAIDAKVPADISFGSPLVTITDETEQQINVYGTRKGAVTRKNGEVVFVPDDERDHVAYPFAPLPEGPGNQVARLTIEFQHPQPRSCLIEVQAKGFKTFVRLECRSTAKYIRVPANAVAIRVVLSDPFPSPRSFALPKRIEIALAEPAAATQ